MAKRTIEQVLAEVKQFKQRHGLSTFGAMSATLNDREWDDLLSLIERLQAFWQMHADPAPR